jgi:hypothetical protein
MRTKFKINNKWEKNLQFWIEGGNSNEKSNSQRIKKTKNNIQNNENQNWNISKLEDSSKILNDQREFWGEEREKRKEKKKVGANTPSHNWRHKYSIRKETPRIFQCCYENHCLDVMRCL